MYQFNSLYRFMRNKVIVRCIFSKNSSVERFKGLIDFAFQQTDFILLILIAYSTESAAVTFSNV